MKTFRFPLCVLTGVLISTLSAEATPYAAGITNNGGTINWHLNESVTNGVVAVLFNVGAGSYAQSNYLGGTVTSPVNAGPQSFSLGSFTNFQIYIFNVGTGAPHQISPDPGTTSPASPLVDFNGPRGVGVNRNPSSPYFGTIYICNASPTASDGVRGTGKGLYALNADFTDAFGYGTNVMPPVGTNAGQIQYGSSTTYGVYRVFVGPDDAVYIGDASGAEPAGSTLGAGVWMAAPDLSSATNLFPFSGAAGTYGVVCSVGTPNAFGSYAKGNLTLFTCEWNRSGSDALGNPSGGFQTIWEYQFYTNGSPLPLPWNIANLPYDLPSAGGCGSTYGYAGNGNPNTTVSSGIGSVDEVVADFYIAPDGKLFCSEERSANTGTTTLWIYDTIANGNCLLWDSLDANNGVDPFATAYGTAVSPDDAYVAFSCSAASGNPGNDGAILLCALDSQPAATGTNVSGLPDVTTISTILYGSGGDSIRGVAWDMADNVYGVSGSDDSMRAFTLGLTTTAITGNDITGTNGTFSLSFPSYAVSVAADESLISQPNSYGNPTNGTFTISRTGSTADPLTVFFTLSGTAISGTTYTASASNSITIPAGSSSAQVTIAANAAVADAPTLYAILTVSGNASYSPTPPTSATMAIANTGPQELTITSVANPSMYRGISNDFASFVITRYGDTNAPTYTIPANAFTYAGTATVGVDYAASGAVTVNPGDQTEMVSVSNPIVSGVYHGNETILVSLNANAGVPIVTGSLTAGMTLVDNADPPATVLWSDPLTNAADSANWTLTFANTNLGTTNVLPIVIPDYPNYTASNPDPNPLDDFDVEFGYGVTNDDVGYSPTMILNGWTNALKMTVNKNPSYVNGHGASAGVNVYPAGMKFSGNYAFRFSMNLSEGTASTTEYNSFGINHYGTNCN
ncbi:MAG TPA: hypothetical protein VGR14_06225, partial [Verrucomicrobiae bacterium]|nr:hypothetical protein [Verrucomicrobiae bacterium]